MRSARPLHDLTLHLGDEGIMLSMLQLTPLLTHLSLRECGTSDRFASSFSDIKFLPNLRSFSCFVPICNFRWSNIPLIIPRCQSLVAARPLLRIGVTLCLIADRLNTMDREVLAQFVERIQDGIEINIHDLRDVVQRSRGTL